MNTSRVFQIDCLKDPVTTDTYCFFLSARTAKKKQKTNILDFLNKLNVCPYYLYIARASVQGEENKSGISTLGTRVPARGNTLRVVYYGSRGP